MVSAAALLDHFGGSLRDILGIALQQKAETKIFFDSFELRLKSFVFRILTQCFKCRDGFLAVDDASFCISSQLFDARDFC